MSSRNARVSHASSGNASSDAFAETSSVSSARARARLGRVRRRFPRTNRRRRKNKPPTQRGNAASAFAEASIVSSSGHVSPKSSGNAASRLRETSRRVNAKNAARLGRAGPSPRRSRRSSAMPRRAERGLSRSNHWTTSERVRRWSSSAAHARASRSVFDLRDAPEAEGAASVSKKLGGGGTRGGASVVFLSASEMAAHSAAPCDSPASHFAHRFPYARVSRRTYAACRCASATVGGGAYGSDAEPESEPKRNASFVRRESRRASRRTAAASAVPAGVAPRRASRQSLVAPSNANSAAQSSRTSSLWSRATARPDLRSDFNAAAAAAAARDARRKFSTSERLRAFLSSSARSAASVTRRAASARAISTFRASARALVLALTAAMSPFDTETAVSRDRRSSVVPDADHARRPRRASSPGEPVSRLSSSVSLASARKSPRNLGGGGGKRCARRETVDQLGFRRASSSSRAFTSVAASGARGGAGASRDMFGCR